MGILMEVWKLVEKLVDFIPVEVLLIIFMAHSIFFFNKIKKDSEKTDAEQTLKITGIQNTLDKMKEDFEENVQEATAGSYLLILKLVIMNEKLPRSTRLEYYDEYKTLGGNSFIDDYVKNNLK
jgi:hypothetical protein